MPGLSFYSNNWPTFHHSHHNTAVPPPPELSPFHDNFAFSDTNHFSSFNNDFTTTNNYLPFHNSIKYPTLSSSYNPLTTHQCYSNSPFVPNCGYGHEEFFHGQIQGKEASFGPEVFPLNPMEQMQPEYYSHPMSYPMVPDVCSMEHTQPELPPLLEIYQYGGSSSEILSTHVGGHESNINQVEAGADGAFYTFFAPHDTIFWIRHWVEERNGGERRLSAQSMAARVRRRKISEKTLELGKLVPGGHKMTTAEMFQAAYKYIEFLQAQVGVLQLMSSSKELGSELQDLVTSHSVQEKLYTAGKCIVSQTLAKTLAKDHHHQGI